jgi:hypothetical protein
MGGHCLRQLQIELHLRRSGFFQRVALHIGHGLRYDGEGTQAGAYHFQLVTGTEEDFEAGEDF